MRAGRSLLALLIVGGLAAGGAAVAFPAAAAPTDAGDGLVATRQYVFSIPFQVSAAGDPAMQPIEVHLLVSADGGKHWAHYATQNPTAGKFDFRASRDGEYWFMVRTLDRLGRQRPEGPERPELRVVVDTEPPRLTLDADVGTSGEVRVRWRAEDPHLVPQSFRLQYQSAADAQWQTVPLQDVQQNGGLLSGEAMWWSRAAGEPIFIRAEVQDRAGNMATVRKPLEMPRVAQAPTPTGPTGQSPPDRVSPPPKPPTTPPYATAGVPLPNHSLSPHAQAAAGGGASPSAGWGRPWSGDAAGGRWPAVGAIAWPADGTSETPLAANTTPRPSAITASSTFRHDGGGDRTGSGPAGGVGANALGGQASPEITQLATAPADPSAPAEDERNRWTPRRPDPPAPQPPAAAPSYGPVAGPVQPPLANRFSWPSDSPAAAAPAAPAAEAGLPAAATPQVTRSRRFQLEYDVDAVGPSGVARVVLWATRDGGRSWQAWGEDADRQSPFPVEVPEDGAYGFRIEVESGNGLGGRRPQPGEPADAWIVVDTQPPQVKITSAIYGSGDRAGSLEIHWQASDRQLAPRPITLQFAGSPGGPWTTIAEELPNTGRYDWRVGQEVPAAIYLRIEARDAAGNVGFEELQRPIANDGLIPRGRIRGITPIDAPPHAYRPPAWR